MPTAQSVLAQKSVELVTISPDATVREAAAIMNERHIGALVVTRGGEPVGMFTERDILRRVVAADRDPSKSRVGELMTAPLTCCKPDSKLTECQALMTDRRIRHLPVIDGPRLLGMLSAGDIMAFESASQRTTIEYMQEYIGLSHNG